MRVCIFILTILLLFTCQQNEVPKREEDPFKIVNSLVNKKPLPALKILEQLTPLKQAQEVREKLKKAEAALDEGNSEQVSVYITEIEMLLKTSKSEVSIELLNFWLIKGLFALNTALTISDLDDAQLILKEIMKVETDSSTSTNIIRGKALYGLGKIEQYKSNSETAMKYYLEALDIFPQKKISLQSYLASTHNNIGVILREKINYKGAKDHFERAKDLWTYEDGKFDKKIAHAYNNLGLLKNDLGYYKEAREYHEKALEIRRNSLPIGDVHIGISMNNVGLALSNQGNYDEALNYFKEQEAMLNSDIKNRSDLYQLITIVYNNLGQVYYYQKDYTQSLLYFEKELKLQTDALERVSTKNLAQSYFNIATSFIGLGNLKEARINLQKAKDLDIDKIELARIMNCQGDIHIKQNSYERAIKSYKEALANLLSVFPDRKHPDIADCYANLANAYIKNSTLEIALKFNKDAQTSLGFIASQPLEAILAPRKLFQILLQENQIRWKLYHKDQSLQNLETTYKNHEMALNLFEYLRKIYQAPIDRQNFIDDSSPLFEGFIKLNLILFKKTGNKDFINRAIKVCEQSKMFLLKEVFNRADFQTINKLPHDLYEYERILALEIAQIEKNLYQQNTSQKSDRLQRKLHQLKYSRDSLIDVYEEQFSDYYDLRYGNSVVNAYEIQHEILEPDQAFVEYFVGDSSIFVFVVTSNRLLAREIQRNFPLEEWIIKLREEILIDPDSTRMTKEYREVAYELYQKIFVPIKNLTSGYSKLIIAPDGILGHLPFDILLTRETTDIENLRSYPFIIENHQISMAYSATLLKEMQKKKHMHLPPKDFIGFSPSFFEGDITNHIIEVEQIQKIMGGDLLIGSAATKSNFKEIADKYRIIHLSTHGKANRVNGDFAFLTFHQERENVETAQLFNIELYNLQFNADMVVLSACETGIGELRNGEGSISLARGFAIAGAKSIITSLWYVSDARTPILMKKFYQNLQNKRMDKSTALHQAKYDYWKNSPKYHPYYWAAFVPIGDMQPINNSYPRWIYIFVLLIAGFFIQFTYRKSRKDVWSNTKK